MISGGGPAGALRIRTGRPLSELDVGLIAGPAASEPFRARLADTAAATQR